MDLYLKNAARYKPEMRPPALNPPTTVNVREDKEALSQAGIKSQL